MYLSDTHRVPEDDTDLGRGGALLGELHDILLHLSGGHLEPGGSGPLVREGRTADALTAIFFFLDYIYY
jgi:hypothetical protein